VIFLFLRIPAYHLFIYLFIYYDIVHSGTLEGKYSLESTDPRESEIRAHLQFSVE